MREKEKEKREAGRNHWSQEAAVTRQLEGRNPRPQTLAPDFIHLIYVLLGWGGGVMGRAKAGAEGGGRGDGRGVAGVR